MVSINVRGRRKEGMAIVGRGEEIVDFYLVQEVFVCNGNKVGGMEG